MCRFIRTSPQVSIVPDNLLLKAALMHSLEWVSGDRNQVVQWSYGTVQDDILASSKRSGDDKPVKSHGGARPGHRHRKPAVFDTSEALAATDLAPVDRVSVHHATTTVTEVTTAYTTVLPTSVMQTAEVISTTGSTALLPGSSSSNDLSSSVSSSTSSTASASGPVSSTASAGNLAYHKFWRQTQQEFTEDDQQAAWGFWYYATTDVDGLTHQSGADVDVRGQFTSTGALNSIEDTDYRAINSGYPVFGFATDLGSIGADSVESLFTINLAQDPVIQFEGAAGTQRIPSYWSSTYSGYEKAVSFFYSDYEKVASLSTDLDNQIATDSASVSGSDYATLTSIAVRQAFGALQVSGNSSDTYIFLKEISSDGDIQTVDVIFPTIPIILYLVPSWMKLLLDPLFIYQEAGLFTQGDYALHDLGSYPNATGAGTEKQPLEECGNMLIMTLTPRRRAIPAT